MPGFVAFLTLLLALARADAPPPPFAVDALDQTVPAGGSARVAVSLTIPDGYHIFREMLAVTAADAAGLTVGSPVYPEGEVVPDPMDPTRTREQYAEQVTVDVPVSAPASGPAVRVLKLKVRYQACRDTLCLLPQDVYADAAVTVVPRGALALPLLMLPAAGAQEPAGGEVPVIFTPGAARDDHLVVRVDLQGDWHLNKLFMGAAAVDAPQLQLGEPLYPPAHPSGKVEDGTWREDFVEDFDLVVPVSGPAGSGPVKVAVSFQACKGVSLCMMPTTQEVLLPSVTLTGAALPPPPAPSAPAEPHAEEPSAAPAPATPAPAATAVAAAPGASTFAAAREQGVLALLLVCFLAGIAVSVTPCVLPMVPITMGMIGARSAGSRLSALGLTGAYVLGLAIVYTGLGVFAGVTGALFGSWLQSPLVTGGIALFFVVMGAAMFGFFDVGVPSFIANRVQGGAGGRGGFFGAFVVGMIGAVVAGPCSGPVVVSILALIGQGGEVALGAALMFAFSVGMGMIFVVTGLASGWLPSRGPWMVVVKKAFGVVMWLGAIYYAAPHLPLAAVSLLTAAVLLFTAVFAWPHPDDGEGWFLERMRQVYALGGGLVGAYLLVGTLVTQGFILPPLQLGSSAGAATKSPGIVWLSSEAEAIAKAKELGKPLMIDFTAEWCAACHEMEKYTYTDPAVVAASEGFVTVMIDCTSKEDPAVRAVQEKYGVLGLPTVVFVTPEGQKVGETVGFVKAEDFLPVMQSIPGAS